MRIAIFCHKFWPAVGGLCTYTGRLAEYLVEHGHDVRVFTARTQTDSAAHEHVSPNLVVRRFETKMASHPPYYFMPGLLKLAATSEFQNIDVVHSVGYYFFGTVFGHGVARARRVPHICTPVYTLNPSSWQRKTFDRVAGRPLVRNVNHVIPQSEHELQLMRSDRFDVTSSTIVPFGVDSSLFDQNYDVDDLRRHHGIGRDDKVLLFVGKVMSPKGAFDCLEVAARLRSSGRSVRLIMIGDVHDREREAFAARIRALGVDDAVILPGPITDRREISRYYQLSDAVLFPSQYEQFGIVAIEAAASGRPLLGTPVGIMQTIVPRFQFGLLHPFGDIERFTRNAHELLDAPRYRENAIRHRPEILSQYDWRTISAETERIYQRAMRQGRE
jgi:glycosyltransferase involved in cell wall biosynthesis